MIFQQLYKHGPDDLELFYCKFIDVLVNRDKQYNIEQNFIHVLLLHHSADVNNNDRDDKLKTKYLISTEKTSAKSLKTFFTVNTIVPICV